MKSASGKRPAGAKTTARTTDLAQQAREQEVLRANHVLAAYFKGRRTEREARAALKIIKAFIRDRERMDPAHRRPLPGRASERVAKPAKPVRTPRKKRRKSPPPADAAVTPEPVVAANLRKIE